MSPADPRAWPPSCPVSHETRTTLLRRIRSGLGAKLAGLVEAEDVLHDTLLVAQRDSDRFDGTTQRELLAWLAAIARNRILALHRQTTEQPRPRRNAGLPAALVTLGQPLETLSAPASHAGCEAQEEVQEALSILASLSPHQRTSIVLRDLLDLPWRTIGLALDRSPEGARRLHRRACKALEASVFPTRA